MEKIAFSFLFCWAFLLPAAAQEVDFDVEMRRYGLVDIRETDPAIRVELKYATDDNFVGRNMYGELRTAYLVPAFAAKVAKARRLLHEMRPDYTLLVYDAARPLSVQRLWRVRETRLTWPTARAAGGIITASPSI